VKVQVIVIGDSYNSRPPRPAAAAIEFRYVYTSVVARDTSGRSRFL